MKKALTALSILTLMTLASCHSNDCGCAPPLITRLAGRYEWIKTVGRYTTVTPQQSGFQQEMNFYWQGSSPFVTFTKNDSLLSKTALSQDSESEKDNWIILKSPEGKFIKYKFIASGELEVSEFLPSYNANADTLHHHYQYIGEPIIK